MLLLFNLKNRIQEWMIRRRTVVQWLTPSWRQSYGIKHDDQDSQ